MVMKRTFMTTEEWKQSADATPTSPFGQIRDFLCSFYCDYPEWTMEKQGFGWLDRGSQPTVVDMLRFQALSRLCQGRCSNRPNRPAYKPEGGQSITGGQCPVTYNLSGRFFTPSGVISPSYNQGNQLRGPLSNWRLVPSVAGSNPRIVVDGFNPSNGQPVIGSAVVTWQDGAFPTATRITADSFSGSVSRVDGQPDNCGNPSTPFPSPPPSLYNREIPITRTGWNINIGIDGTVNIPVNFTPVFNNTLIPVLINIGGVRLVFDAEGLIQFNPTVNLDIDILSPSGDGAPFVPLPDSPPEPDVPPSSQPYPRKFPPIEEPPEPCETCEEVETGLAEYLRVTVNTSSYRGKWFYPSPAGDPIIFAGHLLWLSSTGVPFGEELPIRRVTSIFRKPIDAVGYRLTALSGAVLTGSLEELEIPLSQVYSKCE